MLVVVNILIHTDSPVSASSIRRVQLLIGSLRLLYRMTLLSLVNCMDKIWLLPSGRVVGTQGAVAPSEGSTVYRTPSMLVLPAVLRTVRYNSIRLLTKKLKHLPNDYGEGRLASKSASPTDSFSDCLITLVVDDWKQLELIC